MSLFGVSRDEMERLEARVMLLERCFGKCQRCGGGLRPTEWLENDPKGGPFFFYHEQGLACPNCRAVHTLKTEVVERRKEQRSEATAAASKASKA